uniref:Major facilitator superfamily (MFS) profile domain-containing protein n=1 Tax=Graphocephala atropunctata TaxID=36148 RepID=A0A1B6KNB7_9HEMI
MTAEQKISYRNLYLSAFIINIVYFGVGESNVWTSPAIPRLKEEGSKFAGTSFNEAWLVSCFAIGQVLGPLISGCFMDTLGRKPTTFLIILFLVISSSLLAIASTVEVLYIARVFGGFSFGMSVSVLPVYVAELSDPAVRATLNSFPLASRSLGYFVMYAVGPIVSYMNLILITIVAPVVALLLIFLLPESPYHLFAKGKSERAHQTVTWLRRGAPKEVIQAEVDTMQKAVEEMKANKRSFRALFSSRASIRALYISCGLLFFLQMSGIPLIMSITESLFILAQVNISTKLCTLVFGGLMLTVGLLGPIVTRHFGFKTPLVISAFGMFLSLSVFGAHFYLISLGHDMSTYSLVPLSSLVAYISFFSLGFSNSAFAVVGELFAPNVKALGTSLTNSIGFACALLSIQLYYAIKSALGIHFGIWTFALTNALAVPFTFFFVPNTSGMSLVEIQEMLSKPWFDKRNKVVPLEEKYTMNEVC